MEISMPQSGVFREAVRSVYEQVARKLGKDWVERVLAESAKHASR
jgi:hypothetical protein